ncbi:MAG: hypothetical protein ACRC0R_06335 [Cetobacterium sp.]
MKKYILLSAFLVFLLGCSNSRKDIASDFFVPGNFSYSGGFEKAGFKTASKIIKKDGQNFLVEETIDTATRIERVYLISENSIDLIFVGEESSFNFDTPNLTKKETVLKTPFKVGHSWTSNENEYEIVDYIDAESGIEVVVQKTYPNGNFEKIIYQKGFGKIYHSFTQNN